jgi:cysteinyl-tRNA synthetase
MNVVPVQVFNSMGRELQEFKPLVPGQVHLYTCGPTVYNYAHLGNLRAYLFTDTLRRTLQWKGYDVFHVMNITDVGHMTSDEDLGEDKMEMAAARAAKSPWDIAEFYTLEFQKDLARLNIMPPAIWSKATAHIEEMLVFAETLEAKGYTYIIDDGLYFDTSKVADYGKLALLDLEGQLEGARVAPAGGKRNPPDFAIWRRSPRDRRRLMEWISPWGPGAPGWHLECSVMSLKYLGRNFDIHTGGVDHRQVHHCNEIAQNQAYLGTDFGGVNYWMHNEFLNIEEGKMSKSAGNFLRLQTLLDWGIHPLAYRYFALMAHYRSQVEFSERAILAAQQGLQRIVRTIARLRAQAPAGDSQRYLDEGVYSRGASFSLIREQLETGLNTTCRGWIDLLDQALSKDLNTPKGLAIISEILSHADGGEIPDQLLRTLGVFDLVLGLRLLQTLPEDFNVSSAVSVDETEITKLLEERREARHRRDFKRADELRDELLKVGVAVKDSPMGTTWERVSPLSDKRG